MISSEMNKILVLVIGLLTFSGLADAAVRDGTAVSRAKSDRNAATQSRTATTQKRSSARMTVLPARTTTTTARTTTTSARAATARTSDKTSRDTRPSRTPIDTSARNFTPIITSRAAATSAIDLTNTRTGAEYERCKQTYFSCMDQFCSLKNDDYRRCSCNDRVFKLTDIRKVLQDAGEQLTVFTEGLDAVGMTAAQASAMRNETEGEAALTSDKSASKALLQAIMNSIRGEDSSVGGKYSDLNSITISFDTTNAFGMTDVGQAIAAYNGNALYNAVYPQCRNAVRADCNDASLQRAITAYLMAIEQDCNTVQTAIEQTQKEMKAAVREGNAMLDLARVENRQNHNSSNFTACMGEVENAILSEEVCGANYHKCLDNGEYIDISTGAPITGVKDFYKLEQMLVFSDGIEAAHQRLSKNNSNRIFVSNFENRVKKFAEPALDKCVDISDDVWSEYLDRAMLAIYYAQKDKVAQIKQGCFDYVSACYMNGDTAITAAMSSLGTSGQVVLQPDKVTLTNQMCTEYVESCNNMFDDNIIVEYINKRQDTDTLTACRAIVKQCFDKFGGTNYENFYYPYSGMFKPGAAPDWFTLYHHDGNDQKTYVSECAKQLLNIAACSDPGMIERAFGGLDSAFVDGTTYEITNNSSNPKKYGITEKTNTGKTYIKDRYKRATGVATEVYNQVISILSTQCMNLQGRFVEIQFVSPTKYNVTNNQACIIKDGIVKETPYNLYKVQAGENMCPRDYELGVDTQSWGACLCWENGGRRSKFGKSAKCVAALPTDTPQYDKACQNTTPCDENTPCPEGYICTNNICEQNATPSTTCDENTPCPAGYTCTNGICKQTCNENTPCPAGYTCTNGICEQTCNESTHCPDGYICTNGSCTRDQKNHSIDNWCTLQINTDNQACYKGIKEQTTNNQSKIVCTADKESDLNNLPAGIN